MNTPKRRWIAGALLAATVIAITTASSCGGSSAADQSARASEKLQGSIYQTRNNIDFRNYNLRQRISDDPSTIWWCTYFPPGVSQVTNGSTPGGAITVPIAGKLTSSNKRPYRSTDDNGLEVPGPDHMFGSSAEYNYGFDPTLSVGYQFIQLPGFCTTAPTVWQTQATTIVVKTQATLTDLSKQASEAIKNGDEQKAFDLLKQAETEQKVAK